MATEVEEAEAEYVSTKAALESKGGAADRAAYGKASAERDAYRAAKDRLSAARHAARYVEPDLDELERLARVRLLAAQDQLDAILEQKETS